MAIKTHIVRTSFSDKQWGDVEYLLAELRVDTPHELIRVLVRDRAEDKRGENKRYGTGGPKVARETKAERRTAIEALPDDELTTLLANAGAFAGMKYYEDDEIFVSVNGAGKRIVRHISRQGGADNETPLVMLLNEAEKKKLI